MIMHTMINTSQPVACGTLSSGLFILLATLMLLPNAGHLYAQPIDLCSAGPIYLEMGVLQQVEVYVPADKYVKVTIIQDCTEDPEAPPANNGVYATGGTPSYGPPTYLEWDTYSADEHNGQLAGSIPVDAADTFTLTLDACEGTKILVECVSR